MNRKNIFIVFVLIFTILTMLSFSSQTFATVQIAQLEFIQSINIAGSPFKGSEDAPVVIVVFDDFQ